MKIGHIHKVVSKRRAPNKLQTATSGYLLHMPTAMRKKLKAMKLWYRTKLNLKVTQAFLIREYISDGLAREESELRKAELGRFHAKVRKSYETLNQ